MVEFNESTYEFAEGGADDMVCLVIRDVDSISDGVSFSVTITLTGDPGTPDAGSLGTCTYTITCMCMYIHTVLL